MMEFSYENQGSSSFLAYKLSEAEQIDTFTLNMITCNRMNGILPVSFFQRDDSRFLNFNISSKTTLKSFLSGQVSGQRLLNVFLSIADTLVSSEEYMIDSQTFIVDPAHIFVNVSNSEAQLICLPVLPNPNVKTDMCKFYKDILFEVQFSPTENSSYLPRLINFLNSCGSELFSLSQFRDLIRDLIKEAHSPKGAVQNIQVQPVSHAGVPMQTSSGGQVFAGVNAPGSVQSQANPVQGSNQIIQPYAGVGQVPGAGPAGAIQPPKAPKSGLFHFGKTKAEKRPQAIPLAPTPAPQPTKKEKEKAQKNASKTKNAPAPSFQIPQSGNSSSAGQGALSMAIPGQQPVYNTASAPAVTVSSVQRTIPTPQVSMVPISSTPVALAYTVASQGFGETTVLGSASGETTVLGGQGSEMQGQLVRQPFLLRLKSGETFPVTKAIFRMGKEKSYVDYFVSDNTAVSRSHADLIIKDGKYYIQDNNSTNHTYVNDQMIPSNTPVQIEDGATFSLANEKFRLTLK